MRIRIRWTKQIVLPIAIFLGLGAGSGGAGLSLSGASSTAVADTLQAGQQLNTGQYLLSSDGRYKATMQADGNFVVYGPSGAAGWNTGPSSASRIVMQTDGNLVAYNSANAFTWSSTTATSYNDRLVMQTDGNLVIYSGNNNFALWSSRTGNIQSGDTLFAGQQLVSGRYLVSSGGRYRATMQADGNFVVYGPSGAAGWNTGPSSASRIVMQTDGNLVAYNSANTFTWSSTTAPSGGDRLVMQADGNLVIYNDARIALWVNGTHLAGGDPSAVTWANAHNGEYYGSASEQPASAHQWSGYCWTFVYDAFGGKVPREATAQAGWNYYTTKGMTHAGSPPAGSIAFWSYGSDGHAAVAVGGGLTVGTHGTTSNRYAVEKVAYDSRGLAYLGWVSP